MSEAMHTPGPWEVVEVWSGPASERGLVYARIQGADGSVGFAGAYLSKQGKPDDECRANARLIAAAPELLEALEKLSASANNPGVALAELRFTVKRITKAAIAKARGQQ